MIAVHARYRGNDSRRADLVKRSAEALSTLEGVGRFEVVGVEDIRAHIDDAEAACMLVMALLSDGNWAIGIGITEKGPAIYAASDAVGVKAGSVKVVVEKQNPALMPRTLLLLSHCLATCWQSARSRAVRQPLSCARG